MLGEGAFGIVLMAEANGMDHNKESFTTVAVKSIKRKSCFYNQQRLVSLYVNANFFTSLRGKSYRLMK